MAEYLAPGVYVEEVVLGPRPIEGVSTSTTGFVGMAQRGPVNKPTLVTNVGEYQRLFGGYLDDRIYRGRGWLPYAVEGFFQNGGQRAYIVRVANLPRTATDTDPNLFALTAHTTLPDRALARRTLARRVEAGATAIDLPYWAGLSVGTILQIGDGANAEYVAITGFTNRIQITPALTRAHAEGVTVMQTTNPLTTLVRPPANAAGASDIQVAARDGLAVDTWVHIQDGASTEFVRLGTGAGTAGAGNIDVTPTLRFSHASGRNVRTVPLPAAATGALAAEALAGANSVQLDAAAAAALAQNDWMQIQGNAGQEEAEADFVRIVSPIPAAPPFNVSIVPTLRFNHDSGREVRQAPIVPPVTTTLTAPTSIQLAAAAGLTAGNVVMLEDGTNTEFVQLGTVPGAASFDVPVTPPLRFSHAAGINVRRLDPPAPTTTLTADAGRGNATITVAARDDLTAGNVVELLDGAQTEYAYVVTSGVGAGDVTLLRPLRYPHPAGTPVRRLPGTIQVTAGPAQPNPTLWPEPGTWGNDIRLQVESACILRSDVRTLANAGDPFVELATANGIEVGSVLRLPGNRHATVTLVQGTRVFLQGGVPAAITAADLAATGDDAWRKQVMTCEFRLIFSHGGADEVFDELSMDPRHSRYFATLINDTSKLVRVEDRNSTATPPLNQPLTTAEWYPGGGSDGLGGVTAATYQGQDADDADRRTGLFALLNNPRVSIVAIPGQTEQDVQQALMAHCENNKYRFAVLDSIENASLDTVQSQRSLYDSKYAALYYPWIQIFDPLRNKPVFAPPSGHICGLYARSDQEVGVHKAPANAVLQQVRDLQATITKGQQDILNPRGINAIRAFPGRGIRVWGARTVSSDALWRYVNVRRLFIFLEQSIDEGSQYAVFEPNDLSLWNRLKASLTAFLTTVWRTGALQGATEEEAFFVKVGLGETMTQDDIDNGRVIILIGVAPVKPAEFVIFRIGQKAGGSDVSE